MQYSLSNYVRVYGEDGPAPAADGYPEWFTGGLPGEAPNGAPGDVPGDLLETLPDAGLSDAFRPGPEHCLPDELPDDWSDYFQDGPVSDSTNDSLAGSAGDLPGRSNERPVFAPSAEEAATPRAAPPAAPSAEGGDEEAFVEFDLAVPVHGLTLRQAIAAVSRAVREKRDELEAWGFCSYGDFCRARPGKVFRWRFLGYQNGLMRYRAQRASDD